MFDSNFNVINGTRYSGRTTFVNDLALKGKEVGLKFYFIGSSRDEIKGDNFDGYKIMNLSDITSRKNQVKIVEVIREITEGKNYDYLIIDDYDHLPTYFTGLINDLNVKKIVTSNVSIILKDRYPENVKYFDIELFGFISVSVTISDIVGDIKDMSTGDFIKMFIRDKKINKLIDE